MIDMSQAVLTKIKTGSRSIRWKIVLIYCLLVFVAVSIVGVFMISRLDAYYKNTMRDNLMQIVNEGTLLKTMADYDSLAGHRNEIKADLEAWGKTLQSEVFVIDRNMNIVATTAQSSQKSAIGVLDDELIFRGLTGKSGYSESYVRLAMRDMPVMNIAFPISGGKSKSAKGVLLVRADMTSIEKTISESTQIVAKAILLAILVTVVLGFFIARSITVPINDVTAKARRMAAGDFSCEVDVKSDDEIGQLAMMFNMLRSELDKTIGDMTVEKNKLETILRYMAGGLIATDMRGNVIHVNPAAISILKKKGGTLINLKFDEMFAPLGEQINFKTMLEKSKNSSVAQSIDAGDTLYAARYTRFQDDDGKDIGIILLIHDVTQMQRLENMQMDFVANVSHELKTPLTTIKSYTETLMNSDMLGHEINNPEISRNFLEIIDKETDRMNRLVIDLLKLSKLDNNRQQWNKKQRNLAMLVNTAIEKVRMTAEQNGQTVVKLYDENMNVQAVVDRDGIEQVLMNVLSNAIRYNKKGAIVEVDISILKPGGKQVMISVRDYGIGISESDLPRIFERFFRADKARSREKGGTGLGLAITKQIVEDHDGYMEVESVIGEGSLFKIILPTAPIRGMKGVD